MRGKLNLKTIRWPVGVALSLPFYGGVVDLIETPHFKQFVAELMVNLINQASSALITSLIRSLFYSG